MTNDTVIITSVRLPRDVHEVLRKRAFDMHLSMHKLLLDGAAMVIAKYAHEVHSEHVIREEHAT